MSTQLSLPLLIQAKYPLEDFLWENNPFLHTQLIPFIENNDSQLYIIHGKQGTGKTHLLQGLCDTFSKQDKSTMFLPLDSLQEIPPDFLEDIDTCYFIGIDNIDSIAGQLAWEKQLFHFYNRILLNNKSKVIFTASTPVAQIPFILPDLKSRLMHLLAIEMNPPNDDEKALILIQMAHKKGILISHKTANFLITRLSRDLSNLMKTLDALDLAALQLKRKMTIPFIKSILGLQK